MRQFLLISIISSLLLACSDSKPKIQAPTYDDALLNRVRAAANSIPGAMPTSINYIKYASTARTWADLVEGGSKDPATMARTVFQVQFPDGFIMVDAGMDRPVHHFFEKDGPQPFDDTLASRIASTLQNAKLILITHEHGDHVAGVIRNANNTLPGKTILTTEQANILQDNPQMPEIKLDPSRRAQYLIANFESILPVAPGMVLIKAPGHTDGEIMIYTKLQDGKEYIFTGDITWTYSGIKDKKQKPSSERKRVGEDKDLVQQQIEWLNKRLTVDKMTILVSHDDVMLPQFAAQGLIKSGF